MDLELYQEPAEVDEVGGEVLPGFGSSQNPGSHKKNYVFEGVES